jgi:hypothetical protein
MGLSENGKCLFKWKVKMGEFFSQFLIMAVIFKMAEKLIF